MPPPASLLLQLLSLTVPLLMPLPLTRPRCKQPELWCLNVADAKLRMAVHLQTEFYMPVLPSVTTGRAYGAIETVLCVKTAL